jgi:2,3-bisphosphoglycerate-independent phosphoglycerate mutase
MSVLFLFLDGVGLGENDPHTNPLARARMPHLQNLLGGQSLTSAAAPYHGAHASLLALDAALGVPGLPQSATGQAVLLTGINVPAALGYHYGPKPNPEVAQFLGTDTLFHHYAQSKKRSALINAYPQGYFDGIHSGKRLYSAIPLAATNAGLSLMTREDYFAGRALSVDFTGEGWRSRLNEPHAPLLSPPEAGARLAQLARDYDFCFFEYWLSDYAGHKQDMDGAVRLLEEMDAMLGGFLPNWDGLLVLTSDHGNMEDMRTRRHTDAPVPCLLIGEEKARREFCDGLTDLCGVAGKIWAFTETSSPSRY